MFSKYALFKLPFTSSASRNVYRYRSVWWHVYWKAPRLSLHKFGFAGRGDSGRRILRSRSSLLHYTRTIQINHKLTCIKAGLLSNFIFVPYRNKFLSLVRYAHGGLSYYLTTENHRLFSFFSLPSFQHRLHFGITFSTSLFWFPNLTKISLISLTARREAQYCRSAGTVSKVLKLDRKTDCTLIRLPSGRAKLVSMHAFASLGRILFKENKKFLNSKAGYWRGFGFKPIVRGVAMNPVDHPHGGRTNSIKYPRTPWGKTTKYK